MSGREISNELEVGNLDGLPDVAGITNDMLGTLHQFFGTGFQQSERRMWASLSLRFFSTENSEFITKIQKLCHS